MKKSARLLSVITMGVLLAGCSSARVASWNPVNWASPGTSTSGSFKIGNPYKIDGVRYVPQESYTLNERGIASWYGPGFNGKLTANGEIYNKYALTAAHRTLQMPSIARVTNLENGRSIIVRINDRGPFAKGRIIDMSKRGAELLQFINQGTAKVRVQVLENESRLVAEAAKRGQNVAGIEIALNEGKSAEEFLGISAAPTVTETIPVLEDNLQLASVSSQEPLDIKPQKHSRHYLDLEKMNDRLGKIDQGRVVPEISDAKEKSRISSLPAPLDKANDVVKLPDPLTPLPKVEANTKDIVSDLVKNVAVNPTDIFVQAGSFSQESNAVAYADRLSSFGKAHVTPVNVNNQTFYRVRIGPLDTVQNADTVLANMSQAGEKNAIIIVGE